MFADSFHNSFDTHSANLANYQCSGISDSSDLLDNQ